MKNLIHDAYLPVKVGDEYTDITIPDLLALLVVDQVEGFDGLLAHQRQPWFLFLVQLAALALAADEQADIPADSDADEWRRLLLALTPGAEETAWSLYVADHRQPALLQPPVLDAAAWARMQPLGATPDAIDVLITAKNHDVKQARIGTAQPHHWLYALVSLQTSQGFLGRGNFGIARMNGGFGSRPLVELVPSMRWGARFRRGVAVALRQRRLLLARNADDYAVGPEAHRLLWLLPWDGDEGLPVPSLDPCFIEVCRRVRLCADGAGTLSALGRPSEGTRVEAKERKGLVGDPWIPVNRGTGGAYTVSGEGFRYDRVADLLFDKAKFDLPPSLTPFRDDPPDMLVHLSALVRGQGKTEGLHDRVLPVNPRIMQRIAREDEREKAHELAKRMVDEAKISIKAVKNGLLCLVQGAPEKIDFEDRSAQATLVALDGEIDGIFFTHLWQILGAETDEARLAADTAWRQRLHDLSATAFQRGCRRLPVPSARRERSLVLAQALYRSSMNKNLPLPARATPETEEAA
ncbi:CRISPR-associated protein Cse1 [Niveispirillum sp. BGYR6]|uniref:CRISPR-associated protein Cse1 n=1 Tax=Niveispirillum sp. BGYR6 TaxID=2971249 RepID=UPI0022B94B0A|nr:CRISPR-associated protein Cse1 [Niveispirillum sp. BGYR6]MDG5497352.1 CRISPR-associated protein Cse1 [Niveispirillum sp. BGYR6]